MDDIRYKINEPDATAETFEGEVIVINLANGRYHSLRGTGAWLWQALTAGLGSSGSWRQAGRSMRIASKVAWKRMERAVNGRIARRPAGAPL